MASETHRIHSVLAGAKPTKVGLVLRVLLPLGALLAFLGYVGPWVDHRVAGMAILGLDLGEYVKFLPLVRAGTTNLWREGFYLPLVAISLALSLCTWRHELRWPQPVVAWLMIALQVIGAIAAALNMLPPAWTPQRMLTPEFQQQLAAILLCLAAMALGPFLALLPRLVTGLVVLLLSATAAVVPVMQFLRVLPEIGTLYNHPLVPGWGMYLMLIGLAMLMVMGGLLAFAKPAAQPARYTSTQNSRKELAA
ncbi:MAG: hypothetical protein U0X20_24040 [Caldilineaceae bacterium]